MRLRESKIENVDIFHLEGEIDLHYAPALRSLVQGKLQQRRPALVLDLSGVSFIDSTGISVMLEYLRDAGEFSGRLLIAGPTEHVRTVFEIVGLTKVLSICDNVGAAVDAVRAGSEAAAVQPLFGSSHSQSRGDQAVSAEGAR
jgi:anti-sigma B factor antagonist